MFYGHTHTHAHTHTHTHTPHTHTRVHTHTHTPHTHTHTHVRTPPPPTQGYEPVIFYPKRTSKEIYQLLVNQCEKLNIAFIEELPTSVDIDQQYNIVLDAIFGFSFKGSIRPPFDTVLRTLSHVTLPIASVDIPSGEHSHLTVWSCL